MTKVSVFGQEATESKQLKPIEFVKRILPDGSFDEPTPKPEEWDNVILFRKKDRYFSYDVILASDDNSEARGIYIGHWNDGVI